MRFTRRISAALLGLAWIAAGAEFGAGRASAAPPNFTRDIQPILSEKCYQCHGPDAAARKAELRFDEIDAAIEAGAIVPGDAAASPLVARIMSDSPKLRMPALKSNKVLTEREKGLLTDWIAAGAKHEKHWAFQPVRRPAVPAGAGEGSRAGGGVVGAPDAASAGAPGAIDAFILARLAREGVSPTRETDRETLLRRMSFDLTGLPPTLAEMDAFLADASPDAYEKTLDRLLASPRYGERMALDWLDAARYADTFGYQADRETHVWPWRDWVIRAFNANMPYDEFITDQLAGDLLPNATADQRLATAFNRLHRQTNEGGSTEEEFRKEYVADRTEVLGTAVLGLTLECARCHDHKFDPTAQREFYELSAFFANIDESGLYSHFTETAPTPAMSLFGEGQEAELARRRGVSAERLAALKAAEEKASFRFMKWLAAAERSAADQSAPEKRAPDAGILPARKPLVQLTFDAPPEGGKLANLVNAEAPAGVSGAYASAEGTSGNAAAFDGDNAISVDKLAAFERSDPFTISMRVFAGALEPRMVLCHRSEAASDAASRGYEMRLDDGHVVFMLCQFWPGDALCVRTVEAIPAGKWVHLAATYDGSSSAAGARVYIDGKPAALEVVRDGLTRTIRYGDGGGPSLKIGARFRDHGFRGGRIDDFRVDDTELAPLEIEALASGTPVADLIQSGLKKLEGVSTARAAYLLAADEPLAKLRAELRAARAEEAAYAETIPQIMTMTETPEPKTTHILGRGNYLNKGEEVLAGTPRFLPPFPADAPHNRLGLAKWLFLPEHPLTARVAVNRLWAHLFGRGLAPTPEDFGAQGEPPSNPELLEHLAARYMELNWDTKAMMREMMLSAAYRRASEAPAEVVKRDPDNALLARGPRHRLAAEEIRDAALAASGLLVERLGGPSVKPYQPEGIWKDVSGTEYVPDKGEGLHRRSMYTFVKRTAPPPSMLLLDSTSRETCVVKRERTETPLQALELLNDPQFVEAARALAQRAMAEHHGDAPAAAEMIFRTLESRRPSAGAKEILSAALEEQRAWFKARPEEAAAYLKVGEAPLDAAADPAELSAMTALAQLAMNYDEFQMKR